MVTAAQTRKHASEEAEKARQHERDRWEREKERWGFEKRLEWDRWRLEMYREEKFKALTSLYEHVMKASFALTPRGVIKDTEKLPAFLDMKVSRVNVALLRAAIYLPPEAKAVAVELQNELDKAGALLIEARKTGRMLTLKEAERVNTAMAVLLTALGKVLNPEVL
jgi:hypothetical protein